MNISQLKAYAASRGMTLSVTNTKPHPQKPVKLQVNKTPGRKKA